MNFVLQLHYHAVRRGEVVTSITYGQSPHINPDYSHASIKKSQNKISKRAVKTVLLEIIIIRTA
jgi:hypothetical protein